MPKVTEETFANAIILRDEIDSVRPARSQRPQTRRGPLTREPGFLCSKEIIGPKAAALPL